MKQQRNKENLREWNRAYEKTEKRKNYRKMIANRKYKTNFTTRLISYKRGAKVRNLNFELSDDEARSLMNENCFYCGYKPADELNGIDRMDNKRGYEPQNCVPCCGSCNIGKHAKSPAEFIDWCKRVADHNK